MTEKHVWIYELLMILIHTLMRNDPEKDSPDGVLLHELSKAISVYEKHMGW